jgi:hypothetical protein
MVPAQWVCTEAVMVFLFFLVASAVLRGGICPAQPPPEPSQRDAIYVRATNEFALASLHKPDPKFESELAFQFAPLIFQEVAHEERELEDSARLKDHLQSSRRLTVYFYQDTLRILGREHIRYSYVWVSTNASLSNGTGVPRLLGIRVTAGSDGRPVLWEILNRLGRAEVIFAAQSLEHAAAAEHGSVLPGRRYALERSSGEAPDAFVAKILEDGPVPMGPMVYVSMDPLLISAVACRCMPTQARSLTSTVTYDLKPLQDTNSLVSKLRSQIDAAFWPGDTETNDRVLKLLRLPRQF